MIPGSKTHIFNEKNETKEQKHRDRTYLEGECLVGLAWAVSEKIPARLYITIGLVAAY